MRYVQLERNEIPGSRAIIRRRRDETKKEREGETERGLEKGKSKDTGEGGGSVGPVQGPMKGGNEMPRRRKEARRSLSDNWSIYIELEFVAYGDGDTLTIDERRRRSRRRGTVPDESDGESEMSECDANE